MINKNLEQFRILEESYCQPVFEKFADKQLFIFHKSYGEVQSFTGKLLGQKVQILGKKLKQLFKPQEKAILMLPQGLEFVVSLLSCFHANIIAIPIDTSKITDADTFSEKVDGIIEDSEAKCMITNTEYVAYMKQDVCCKNMQLVDIDEINEWGNEQDKAREHELDDIAVLLYTSGSSAKPKGVKLSHMNVLYQAIGGSTQCEITEDSRIVSWMPQFHSFGLVFNILAPLYHGAASILFAPDSFISEPSLWIRLLDKYHATHTAASNFAFDYCCSEITIDEVKEMDLSSIRGIFCGGEAVRKETVENFVHKFKSIGLKENIFCPLYGMSESGPAATLKPGENIYSLALDLPNLANGKVKVLGDNWKGKYKTVVSCGKVRGEFEVVCVNLDTMQRCKADEVGEIWVAGPSVANGYLNRPEESANSFGRKLPGTEKGFYRTGDLGFVMNEHVFIIGREKEVMIIHGKNYHPVDVEWTLRNEIPELTSQLCVFSDDVDNVESVFVVVEAEDTTKETELENLSRKIIGCISATYGISVYQVVFVAPKNIPKTGSGKLQRKKCRVLLNEGELKTIYQYGRKKSTNTIDKKKQQDESKVQLILKRDILAKVFEVDENILKRTEVISEIGFDSLKYIQLAKQIQNKFHITCSPVIIFKYQTITKLVEFIEAELEKQDISINNEESTKEQELDNVSLGKNNTDVAIIGMNCNFPGSSIDPHEYWNNIIEGKDCIQEIAKRRPDLVEDFRDRYGNPEADMPKYGGFVDDMDSFDASFFGISPLEAECMDPQQRKTMELTWATIEDAGYDPETFRGKKIGVFLGVHTNDYAGVIDKYDSSLDNYGAYIDTGTHMSIIPNRISRWFDFHGPSEIINTACSSSLIAIHHAVEAIQQGECSAALAGGINLILSTRIYAAGTKASMFAKDGRCKTLDQEADGFVRSEGYGAVLLKPLKEAVRDHDSIYGVIKGSAMNHDGRSSSLRAPNINAQKQLIVSAYQKADIPVQTVTNIEMHGTGTALGDPIEFSALTDAFQELGVHGKSSYCGITSVKTNIGHCESASGVAGVIKVLLSMQHGILPGILHFHTMNPYITMDNTPFYCVDRNREWTRLKDEDGKVIPRRAGVSSFGVGGANAHVILEEYKEAGRHRNQEGKAVIPFSAKTVESLHGYMRKVLHFLMEQEDVNFRDFIYTLQSGRCDMKERKAFVAENLEELKQEIRDYLNGVTDVRTSIETENAEWKGDLKNYTQMAVYWENGHSIDWEQLYEEDKPYRMHLPSYAFEKNRYWITGTKVSGRSKIENFIYPLLQKNTSDFVEQKFTSNLGRKNYFIRDHLIGKNHVLPGVISIEMARKALMESLPDLEEDNTAIQINNLIWQKPVLIEADSVQLTIRLRPEKEMSAEFTISTADFIHSKGIVSAVQRKPVILDLEVEKQGFLECISSEYFYERFEKMGIHYGRGFQTVKEVFLKGNTALGRLRMSDEIPGSEITYYLEPGLLDGAFQTVTALVRGEKSLLVPYRIKQLTIYNRCQKSMWVRVEKDSDETFHIDFIDEKGAVCVQCEAFVLAEVKKGHIEEAKTNEEIMLYKQKWTEAALLCDEVKAGRKPKRIMIFVEPEKDFIRQCQEVTESEIVVLESMQSAIEARYQEYALKLFHKLREMMDSRRSGQTLIQLVLCMKDEGKVFTGLQAMLKTASMENPAIQTQVIVHDSWSRFRAEALEQEAGLLENSFIKYEDKKRYTFEWDKVKIEEQIEEKPWKDNGVYIITGGMGALGQIFASEIAGAARNATIILTGRSPKNDDIQKVCEELKRKGAFPVYECLDVTRREDVILKLKNFVEKYKKIDGILHTAGIIQDHFVMQKTDVEIRQVLRVKVEGTTNLVAAVVDIPVDFIITFSSITGTLGNVGQIDYAAANAFMNYYAEYYNEQGKHRDKKGHILSISWPLWKNGGMQVDKQTEQRMKENMGLYAMKEENGLQAFYAAYGTKLSQVMVLNGDQEKLGRYIMGTKTDRQETEDLSFNKELIEKAEHYLKKLLSSALKLPADKIDARQEMSVYGIDSVMIMQLTERLEQVFGPLSKTLFFEFRSLSELTGYFVKKHGRKVMELVGMTKQKVSMAVPEQKLQKENKAVTKNRFSEKCILSEHQSSVNKEDIAIIGLAGHYPEAESLDEFWINICNGKDCISEVPEERWNHQKYFDTDKNKKGKTYTKWGGFLKDVACFDPLFFNISPREAELLEPQERLMLECVEEMIEDAGYTREDLGCNGYGEQGGKVGVFVGAMFEEYQLYGAQMQAFGNNQAVSGNISSIANRISYYYNLHGPSIALDTMCSSSLTAIHLACESIHNSECGMAIAGGVNVSVHPNKYLLLAQGKFASSKGRCETFGKDGDGYVPSEGVGAILLKTLSKALEDGDHIYGLIKATAINHGGRTNGFTVPNPVAQADVIMQALKEADINPRTISYIEAHGTGTSLGDPIEIAGLTKAFQSYTKDRQFCAIGSVKSNIGHCESAAGIAGITKVLLQMKYKKLVPSIHSDILNPNINFEETPFMVQHSISDWIQPIDEINGEKYTYPRRAGISAFGAGGSNAHIILEEYNQQGEGRKAYERDADLPVIIVLSAKSKGQLREFADRMVRKLESGEYKEEDLIRIAYTLQTGRSFYEERLAILADSLKELKVKLLAYLSGELLEGCYQDNTKGNKIFDFYLDMDEDISSLVESWIEKKKYQKLLGLWVLGMKIDWSVLYHGKTIEKISLPTYPFAKERYWFPVELSKMHKVKGMDSLKNSCIHPLLHINISNFQEQKYKSSFTGEEFFLKDHVVNQRKTLSGAACLEMVRKACVDSLMNTGEDEVTLQNIVWSRPIQFTEPGESVYVRLFAFEMGRLSFEIYKDEHAVCCQGTAVREKKIAPQKANVKKLKQKCSQKQITKESCYELFKNMGIQYGRGHMGIQTLWLGNGGVLAELLLPDELADTEGTYYLNPGMLDSAIQVSIGLLKDKITGGKLVLPYSLDEMKCYRSTAKQMWVLAERNNTEEQADECIDIRVYDKDGYLLVWLKSLRFRTVQLGGASVEKTYKTITYSPVWKKMDITQERR